MVLFRGVLFIGELESTASSKSSESEDAMSSMSAGRKSSIFISIGSKFRGWEGGCLLLQGVVGACS